MHPDTGCTVLDQFANVESIEAVDDMTIRINFDVAKPFPYGPFVGYLTPIIQKAQFEGCIGAGALECQESFGPLGTGPFMVTDFRTNDDVITYAANPNYRVEGQPAFDRAVFKGGGDAESAARAVLETGEADYAWNLQISPAVLSAMEAAGQGAVIVGFATSVERLLLNHTNPDPALGENRSVWMADGSNGHPFLQVEAVWESHVNCDRPRSDRGASSMARAASPHATSCRARRFTLRPTIPSAVPILTQPMPCWTTLASWTAMAMAYANTTASPLKVSYQTSTNAVRQNTQALIKQWWSEIGIETELRNIDAAVFFGGDIASPDTYSKFYTDIEMYTNGSSGTDPETLHGRLAQRPDHASGQQLERQQRRTLVQHGL